MYYVNGVEERAVRKGICCFTNKEVL